MQHSILMAIGKARTVLAGPGDPNVTLLPLSLAALQGRAGVRASVADGIKRGSKEPRNHRCFKATDPSTRPARQVLGEVLAVLRVEFGTLPSFFLIEVARIG
jgi:hypothetical protein